MLRRLVRDRRAVGVAEYALLLFIVLVIAAVTYKYLGGRVRHAGNKTEEQFAAQGASSGGGGGGGANGKSGAGGSGNGQGASGGAAGAGAGGGATGGGGGGSGASGGKASNDQNENGALEAAEEAQGRGIPLWKIIGGVFIILFAIGGYFAFRKQKGSG